MRQGLAIAMAFVVATAGVLPAQGRSRVSVDLGLGGGSGYSNAAYRETGQSTAELTISVRRNPERQLSQLWAIAVGGRGPCLWGILLGGCAESLAELNGGIRLLSTAAASSALCLYGPGGAPCPPKFPGFAYAGALGGVEHHGTFTVRALAGPALYDIRHGRAAAGAQARVDAAGGFSHLQLMIWGTTSQVYRFDGQRFTLTSVGLGLRVQ